MTEPRVVENARPSNARKVLILLMLVGALLRILRYAADRSLWLDEAYLANSILTYSFKQLLTKPLLYWQAAPPGFLLLQKAAVSAFGTSEYALRVVPLLAGVASIPLFYGIVRRCLGPTAQILAMTMFVTLDPLIYYSAEAKQYGLDVMIALAILLAALRFRERPGSWGRLITLGAVGVLGIFCSHPAVFTLAGCGIVLIIDLLRQRRFLAALSPGVCRPRMGMRTCAGLSVLPSPADAPQRPDRVLGGGFHAARFARAIKWLGGSCTSSITTTRPCGFPWLIRRSSQH